MVQLKKVSFDEELGKKKSGQLRCNVKDRISQLEDKFNYSLFDEGNKSN